MIENITNLIIATGLVIGSWFGIGSTPEPVLGANQKISELTAYTTPLHNDLFPIVDVANGSTKSLKWGVATSTMKTLFDTIYSPVFSTSATFFGLISDETGSAGGVVRATSPTLTTPTIGAPTLDVAGTDATGDIYYNGGSGLLTRLPIGSSNEFLRVSGGLPDWDNTALLTNPQTSSSTFTATTSITANNVNNNALILNQLAYSFPSSRGASSTVLTENGSGQLGWYLPNTTILYRSTGSSTVSNTATTTALTVTIPANTMGANGTIRISGWICTVGGGSQHRYELAFGNGSASTTFLQAGLNSANNGDNFEATIWNYSTGQQRAWSRADFVNTVNQQTNAADKVYHAPATVDTTAKSYIAFRAAESASGVETGYCGVLVELIKP